MSCLLWKTATLLSLVWAVGGQLSGDVRLIDSSGSTGGRGIGRLEIYYNGQWGTVCQDGFGPTGALVACRQLGFQGYVAYGVVRNALAVSASTPTWLDDLRCNGSESRLDNCPQNPIGVHNCDRSDDVGLVCAINGVLRLVNTTAAGIASAGRLELFHDEQWGTVCDDSFSPNDARVACRQLGYEDYTKFGRVGTLGFSQASSTTRTWLDELRCRGTERILIDCPANTIGVEDCTHSEDVALVCTRNGDLRLIDNSGGTGGSSGRLEVYNSGQWGTVCDDSFSPNDARVACRQLGFPTYTRYGRVGRLSFNEISSDSPTWLDELRCLGRERRLVDCPANAIGVEDCTHTQDVALICTTNGDLRLVDNSGGTGGSSGRLEFYYNGQWGTVCQDNFSLNDARVACRQLGFSTYTRYGTVVTLGFNQILSDSPTWLDELRCLGTESKLIDCPANTIGVEDCTHTQDVGLVCSSTVTGQLSGDVRLVDSSGSTGGRGIGRLEIYYNGQWGTVCHDGFGPTGALVACRQLDFQGYVAYGVVRNALSVSASTPIWLDDLHCNGSESRLDTCPQNPIGDHNCDRSDDVGLVCAINGVLRLVNTTTSGIASAGRLELFHDGQWGTVCDDSFSPNDARVACRQLGFSTYSRYGAVGALGFSQASSTTRTWLDELRCLGTESRLIDCPANTIGDEDCSHLEDVALVCSAATSTSSPSSTPTTSSNVASISTGVTIPIIFVVVILFIFLFCVFTNRRRRRVGRPATRAPVVANVRSTTVIIAKSTTPEKAQDDTAYPMQSKPQYSNQAPPQHYNMYGSQPAAPYPTGQYPNPAYPYPTGQQPPAPYPTGQQPAALYPGGPPPAPYLSGGGAPPAYPG